MSSNISTIKEHTRLTKWNFEDQTYHYSLFVKNFKIQNFGRAVSDLKAFKPEESYYISMENLDKKTQEIFKEFEKQPVSLFYGQKKIINLENARTFETNYFTSFKLISCQKIAASLLDSLPEIDTALLNNKSRNFQFVIESRTPGKPKLESQFQLNGRHLEKICDLINNYQEEKKKKLQNDIEKQSEENHSTIVSVNTNSQFKTNSFVKSSEQLEKLNMTTELNPISNENNNSLKTHTNSYPNKDYPVTEWVPKTKWEIRPNTFTESPKEIFYPNTTWTLKNSLRGFAPEFIPITQWSIQFLDTDVRFLHETTLLPNPQLSESSKDHVLKKRKTD